MDERPPHSFAQKFIRQSALNQFWSGAVQGLGLVNSFLVLTAFSVYQFGLYQLILSAIAIANTFSTEFFDDVVVTDISRSLAEDRKSDAKRLFLELAAVKIVLGLVVAAAIFYSAYFIAGRFSQDIGLFVRIASVLVVIRAWRSVASKFLGAVVSLRGLGAIAVEEFTKLAFISGFLFFSTLGIAEVFLASIAGALVSAGFVYIPLVKEYRQRLAGIEISRQFFLPAIIKLHGGWVIFRYTITNASRNMIPWLVRFFLDTEAVALYALAANLRALILQLLPYEFGGLLAWEAKYRQRLAYIFSRSMKYALWAGMLAAIVGFLAVPPLISVVFPKYLPAMPLFEALIFALPLIGLARVQQAVLVALREQKLLTARTLSGVAATVAMLALFLPVFGLFALVIENFSSYFYRLWFYQARLSRKYPYLRLRLKEFLRFDAEDRAIFQRGLREMRSFFSRA